MSLPTLAGDDIAIEADDLRATATFVFKDGGRFPVHVGRHTLWRWVGATDLGKIRAAILGRADSLGQLAVAARAAGRKKLSV